MMAAQEMNKEETRADADKVDPGQIKLKEST